MSHTLILSLSGALAATAAHAGGKAWNLARLARYGMPVPDALVLDADLYRALLLDPGVARAVAGGGDVGAALGAAPWPAGLEDELPAALAAAGLADAEVAVRSSATAEDSASHSFAGIHDSVLGVRGAAGVRRAVVTCFASLWSARAVAYRRHLGLADAAVACAVLVCRMVPARAAGVAFTCDPQTGRRDVVRVSAVAGLADALVAGRVDPHESAVEFRASRLSVLAHAAASPLSEGQLLELTRLCLRVHWALGDGQEPQDVEWVHDGARFVLVQARPVTAPGDPRPEGVRAYPTMYSNANIKDAVPVVLSTLSWSMVQAAIDTLLYVSASDAGYPVPPGMCTVRRFGGRAYFDLTLMQWILHACLGVTPHELSVTMGGTQPELPLPALKARPLREQLACGGRSLRLLRRILRMERSIGAHQARHRAEVDALARDEPSTLSTAAIGRKLQALADSAFRFQEHFMIASTGAGAWLSSLQDALKAALPDGGALDVTSALLAGSGGVASAQAGYAIGEMAALAREEPAARAYLQTAGRDPLGWRELPGESPFRNALERFLREFGHRAVYEADILNPRWSDDPTYILDQVRAALDRPPAGAGQALAVRRRGEEALARVSWFRRPAIRWLARKAAAAAAYREGSKSVLAYSLLYSRRLLLEVGRRLAVAGRLDAPEHVFHLAVAELVAWAGDEWDGRGARELVADRLERRARWLQERPPDCFIVEDGKLVALEPGGVLPAGFNAPAAAGGAMPAGWIGGLGLSAGVASGIARCIRHPDDGHRLLQGEVLVAPSTDPAWTPLFLRASAIVMETGGMLSHGAIVAREYGLPAVSNVPGLWARVREGQRVTVDGGKGRIAVSDA